jgi:hypothetical protein
MTSRAAFMREAHETIVALERKGLYDEARRVRKLIQDVDALTPRKVVRQSQPRRRTVVLSESERAILAEYNEEFARLAEERKNGTR